MHFLVWSPSIRYTSSGRVTAKHWSTALA